MGFFSRRKDEKERKKQEDKERQAAREEREFFSNMLRDDIQQAKERLEQQQRDIWNYYATSLEHKDKGEVYSAALDRNYAWQVSRALGDEGLEGFTLHNIAIHNFYHVGMGDAAGEVARLSLEKGGLPYIAFSKENEGMLGFNCHCESLQVAVLTSTSYDEAIDFAKQGSEQYGGTFAQVLGQLEEKRSSEPRYGIYQRQLSLTYYSRVSPELDKGNYAPAISLMEIMLTHAEEPQYDFSYEEYVDLLDDYATVNLMYIRKKADLLMSQPGATDETFDKELNWLAKAPLVFIAKFLPDCEPSDRKLFDQIVESYRALPKIEERDFVDPFK